MDQSLYGRAKRLFKRTSFRQGFYPLAIVFPLMIALFLLYVQPLSTWVSGR